MAFVSNNSQQLSLIDSTFNLTERERKFLEKSWAKTFADKIFPSINEEIFSVLYSNMLKKHKIITINHNDLHKKYKYILKMSVYYTHKQETQHIFTLPIRDCHN